MTDCYGLPHQQRIGKGSGMVAGKEKAHVGHRRRRHPRHHHPSTMPHFVQLAPTVMQDLIATFDLTPIQAAAIVGNLGTESQNFTAYHEHGQAENKGGYGWAQWTGPRRKAFFAWADSNKLVRDTEAASLGYLEHELQTSYKGAITSLKKQTELNAATHNFMVHFEGPGIPNEADRQNHARIALQEYNRTTVTPPAGAR